MHRFYAPHIATDFTLPEDESHHCVKVMRLGVGSEIEVVDGRGGLYECRIADANAKRCMELITRKYGLGLEVVSLHEEYWDNVMEYALRTVKSGLTPNPDVMCNRMIKFGYFEQRWGREFDMTATGHYATTEEIDGVVAHLNGP